MAFWNAAPKSRKGPEEAAEVPPEAPDLVRPLLRRCAGRKTTAYLTITENGAVYTGTFKAVSHNQVTFVFAEPIAPVPLCGTVCTAAFYLKGTSSTFIAHTIRYWVDERLGPALTLELPDTVATLETRRVFRVPIDEDQPISVEGRGADAHLTGSLLNISRMGLRFALDEGVTGGHRSMPIELTLTWAEGTEQITVPGFIAKVDDRHCAVAFDEDADLAGSGLFDVVSLQERLLLRRRKEQD